MRSQIEDKKRNGRARGRCNDLQMLGQVEACGEAAPGLEMVRGPDAS